MRGKLTLIFTLALLGNATASGEEWARKMFKGTSHDFGTVARGSKAVHRFVFKNLYKETLRVSSVSSSCGCTTTTVSNREVKSLESAEIVAVYNTTSFLGAKDATLTVTFDEPYYAQVQLRVKGYIRSDVVLTPGRVNFGSVEHGKSVEKWIDIHYAGREDWKIKDVRTANEYLEAELHEKRRGNGEVEYRMLIRLVGEAPIGYLRDQLSIITDDRKMSRIPVDVEGKVESEVTVSPTPLVFGELQPGQKVTKRIVIRAKRPFRITKVDCDDCFEIKTTDAAKTYHLLPVTFIADRAGKISTKIRIETDLGEGVVPEIPAYADIVEKK